MRRTRFTNMLRRLWCLSREFSDDEFWDLLEARRAIDSGVPIEDLPLAQVLVIEKAMNCNFWQAWEEARDIGPDIEEVDLITAPLPDTIHLVERSGAGGTSWVIVDRNLSPCFDRKMTIAARWSLTPE